MDDSRWRRCLRLEEDPDEEALEGDGEGGEGDAGTECEEVITVEVAVDRADAERRGRLTWAVRREEDMLSKLDLEPFRHVDSFDEEEDDDGFVRELE